MKILILILLTHFSLYALEIDSKLTLRILKVSSSQKTILVNRGIEDGLSKNDHAKFFLTTGVVSRGVAVKVSPTRSVWSLYRIVNNAYIKPDEVLKLKITRAIKITKDESRSLFKDDQSTIVETTNPRDLGIPLAQGADDLISVSNKELKEMEESRDWSVGVRESEYAQKMSIGAYGMYNSQSVSGKASTTNISGQDLATNLNLYFEYTPHHLENSFNRTSIRFIYSATLKSGLGHSGVSVKESISEFGAGATYHFNKVNLVSKFVGFLDFSFLVGSATSTTIVPSTISALETQVSGSSTAFTIGAGFKYFTMMKVDFRMGVDYLSRSIGYSKETVKTGTSTNTGTSSSSTSGPRVYFGAGYRF
ncbi:MAG: hypothetical protein N4A33_03480 [Bacteriovoracaceae bacterium]|jgi:hypothetical protein|nr:hypothetical protein [Bacteriovoracaceae bacterium]